MSTEVQLPTSAPTLANTMLGAVHSCQPMKVCSKCKIEFEKNSQNFYQKSRTYKLKDGTKVHGKFLTALCKKCHGKIGAEKIRNRKCKELDCTVSQYKQVWCKLLSVKKLKIPEASHLKDYKFLLRKIKRGYVFISVDQHLQDIKNKSFYKHKVLLRRKINVPDYDHNFFIKDIPKSIVNKARSEFNKVNLPKGVIANRLGLKLSDCPIELIETQRAIIKINQFLNK